MTENNRGFCQETPKRCASITKYFDDAKLIADKRGSLHGFLDRKLDASLHEVSAVLRLQGYEEETGAGGSGYLRAGGKARRHEFTSVKAAISLWLRERSAMGAPAGSTPIEFPAVPKSGCGERAGCLCKGAGSDLSPGVVQCKDSFQQGASLRPNFGEALSWKINGSSKPACKEACLASEIQGRLRSLPWQVI